MAYPRRMSPSDADHQIDQALRWRLILGRHADGWLGAERVQDRVPEPPEGEGAGGGADLAGRVGEAEQMDLTLEYIYEREQAERAHRPSAQGRTSSLSVPAWVKGVRTLFPREAVEVLERDALVRYGLTELVTDPELLRRAEPDMALLKAILQFKHLMTGDVLEAAREVVRQVVAELSETLLDDCRPALFGPRDPDRRPPRRTFANTDWHRTIKKNLRHWDSARERLVAERIYHHHRQRDRPAWRIIVAVDQSGSMSDSLIHSAVMAGIFATLPAVQTHLVLWDDRCVDLSEHVNDPLEVLMSTQLGGGTQMHPAMVYCAGLVTEPERTIFVLMSDWLLQGERAECLALAHELHEAGVVCIGLNALDADCRPVHDELFARELAGRGWLVASLTPRQLAEHVGRILA